MKHINCILLLILFICQCRHKEESSIIQFPGKPEVPSSIKKEHDYLLDKIHAITLFEDSTSLAAIKLNDLMKHHFKEEEDFVLPSLGLLPLLASGKLPEQSKEIMQLTEKLQSKISHLSVEHQLIKAYIDELKQAASDEHRLEFIEFEKELQKHANTEEEVFFPAAILIAEYLKTKQQVEN